MTKHNYETMDDREFLYWIHNRLQYVHKENFNDDYMLRFRNIINKAFPFLTPIEENTLSNPFDLGDSVLLKSNNSVVMTVVAIHNGNITTRWFDGNDCKRDIFPFQALKPWKPSKGYNIRKPKEEHNG